MVSKLGETGKISIVAVGGQGVAADENINAPLILELIDTEKFCKAYKSGKGRPKTSRLDLSTSWMAKRDSDENTVKFYPFINTLKQWAAGKEQWLYLTCRY